MKTILTTTLALLTFGLHATESKFDLRNTEGKGIGYNVGYTTADYFLMENWTCTELLFNARGHIFNNGNFATNLGLGTRFGIHENHLFGVNAFYDYREHNDLHANQIGGGFEYLSRKVDVRVNGYLPVGKKADTDEKVFEGFEQNEIVVHQKLHAALPLLELEVGAPIGSKGYIAGGPYYLFKKEVRGAEMGEGWGGRVRFSYDFNKYVSIGGSLTYDAVFKTGGTGFISVHIPLGGDDELAGAARDLRAVPIYRNEIIPIQRKRREVSLYTGEKESQTVTVIFVDNTFEGKGNGTIETPFTSLKDAEMHSEPGDIIYVFPGDHTPRNMAEGIILKDDQTLVSSGSTLEIEDVVVPPLTPGDYPIITNLDPNQPVVTNPGNSHLSDFIIMEPWETFFHNWDYNWLVPSPVSTHDFTPSQHEPGQVPKAGYTSDPHDLGLGTPQPLSNNNNNLPTIDHPGTNQGSIDLELPASSVQWALENHDLGLSPIAAPPSTGTEFDNTSFDQPSSDFSDFDISINHADPAENDLGLGNPRTDEN